MQPKKELSDEELTTALTPEERNEKLSFIFSRFNDNGGNLAMQGIWEDQFEMVVELLKNPNRLSDRQVRRLDMISQNEKIGTDAVLRVSERFKRPETSPVQKEGTTPIRPFKIKGDFPDVVNNTSSL